MKKTFKGKYRVPSIRAAWWNYEWNGFYFITICTHERKHYFGKIVDGKMELSKLGMFATTCWYDIPKHFPFVELGAFIVMPNHVHGIVIINKNASSPPQPISGTASAIEAQDLAPLPQPKSQCGSTSIPKIPSLRKSTDDTTPYNKFGPQSKNLASIIRGFKIGVTKNAKQSGMEFGWQPRYYDHIIRNVSAYIRITNYIENNPLKWKG